LSLTQWITKGEGGQGGQGGQRWQSVADAVSELELTRYMRNQLLRDSDVMSMAHGLELRVPLVDRMLCEQTLMIPAAERFRGHKALLTDAVPEVPEWVVNQKKRGFLFPYQKWLSHDWGAAFAEAGQGAPVPMPNWYQQWSVFVLRHCLRSLGVHP
jgi:asparagine synthase (glutamine-hydrolysing)